MNIDAPLLSFPRRRESRFSKGILDPRVKSRLKSRILDFLFFREDEKSGPEDDNKNAKPKKLLFIITQSEFGGAQRFLLELVTHLDSAKYDIMVASQSGELLDVLQAKRITTKTLTHLRRDISPLHDTLAVWEIYKLLEQEKPDTLFLLSSKAGFLGSLAARLGYRVQGIEYRAESDKTLNAKPYTLNPRVIYRIGGWAFNDPQSWFLRKLFLWAEKLSARWKDVIITNSRHDTEQAKQLGIRPREKLVTVYNGINTATLNFLSREEARKRLSGVIPAKAGIQFWNIDPRVPPLARLASGGKPGDDKVFIDCQLIGAIANFYKTKGLPILIEAMVAVHKTHPEAKLVIIGDGRERPALERLTVKYEIQDMIYLPGHLPEAWKYLKAFDLFALPSLKEGFPWVLLEAMAAEVPIVATRVGAAPEVIEDKKTGLLVEPGDAKMLADALKKMLADENLRIRFAANAKETVEQKFRLDTMISRVVHWLS